MKVCVFSTQKYDEQAFKQWSDPAIDWVFLSQKLDLVSAHGATGADAVCVFVNDQLDAPVLQRLKELGVRFIALRCAGFNNVDIPTATQLGLSVVRVPAYSPQAVAEHSVGLMLCLDRKFHKAYNRTRDNNFDLNGLLGFNLHGKTVGIIGTGRIGVAAVKILLGFGCRVLCVDPIKNPQMINMGASYVSLDELYPQADIISLYCPLTPDSRHLINAQSLEKMKDGVMLINTSRGALVDTKAVIKALKSAKIGYLGLDVYEQEADLFFKDLSDQIIADEVFQRLLTFPNVLITGHQAFFTAEAMAQISRITSDNLLQLQRGEPCPNVVG
ncbi:2-hydroxyacid dehydrogenase [Rheinheimera riviphila]|uniref:2-hydroxyacid dehydrogenase n=1 Tax=Rheinheimera riviphila TaxID=1834037 RepID=A0A437R2B6_9GAMM|nr:2-hydroxyacid dehydrogenase [Rheinheimera riviphila]RVU40939.1 2-hydroxyacid dehydrogenase [Rheinheimera riviphila]